jgi:hypothetical protein
VIIDPAGPDDAAGVREEQPTPAKAMLNIHTAENHRFIRPPHRGEVPQQPRAAA